MNKDDIPRPSHCLNCAGVQFREELGRFHTNWGARNLKFKFYICLNCGYTMPFFWKRTWFDQ